MASSMLQIILLSKEFKWASLVHGFSHELLRASAVTMKIKIYISTISWACAKLGSSHAPLCPVVCQLILNFTKFYHDSTEHDLYLK